MISDKRTVVDDSECYHGTRSTPPLPPRCSAHRKHKAQRCGRKGRVKYAFNAGGTINFIAPVVLDAFSLHYWR